VGESKTKEIDDPLEAHPPTTRPTFRARPARHASDLFGIVRDLGALRRLRGQRRPLDYDRDGGVASRHDEWGDDNDGWDNDHHRSPRDSDHDRSKDNAHQRRPNNAHDRRPNDSNDAHHAEEGRADDALHSSDDRAGHDDDGLLVDAVRSRDLLLGR